MSRVTKKQQEIEARRQYGIDNRAYHKAGKAAFGKPKTSKVHKEYVAAKAKRNRSGRALGRLTGVSS